jgi:hypothetical protein
MFQHDISVFNKKAKRKPLSGIKQRMHMQKKTKMIDSFLTDSFVFVDTLPEATSLMGVVV